MLIFFLQVLCSCESARLMWKNRRGHLASWRTTGMNDWLNNALKSMDKYFACWRCAQRCCATCITRSINHSFLPLLFVSMLLKINRVVSLLISLCATFACNSCSISSTLSLTFSRRFACTKSRIPHCSTASSTCFLMTWPTWTDQCTTLLAK